MQSRLKQFFIPHEENNYHPHALHHGRVLFYGVFGIAVKTIAIATALLLPAQAFVIPEVLVAQGKKVIELTNDVRTREGVAPVVYNEKLEKSALSKSHDMVERNYFEHVSPEGKRLRDFLKDANYPYSVAGENLAVGFTTPEKMVNAWVESPTHFANLIDTDFKEIGVGTAVGMYGGYPALYATEHFGNPLNLEKENNVTDNNSRVRGLVDEVGSGSYYNQTNSFLTWKTSGDTIELHAEAHIVGAVSSTTVTAQGYIFELYNYEGDVWSGTLTVPQKYTDFFKVVFSPEIAIQWSDGEITKSTIEWQYLPVVPMGTLEKYELAKLAPKVLGTISPISRGVLYGMIIFFCIALFLKIVIQIKYQHYHVIASTLALIGLLVFLVLA